MLERVFIAGGAGFVGSHFVERLLSLPNTQRITVFDNFSSGKRWHLEHHKNERLVVVEGEIRDSAALQSAMKGHDTVIHLASNPDIARAATEPTIDFEQGTVLTQQIVEAMRVTDTKRILYASGSGVYGDTGELEVAEDFGPPVPISTYGASKLAGETIISAYAYMFGLSGVAFRFGNVVGPRQTHGVGFDFIKKLREDSSRLHILGDGYQSKSYVYITDIMDAVLLANEKLDRPFNVYNVATGDYITVREIAAIVIQEMFGETASVKLEFTGGDRGWKGDVPIVRLNTDKIKALGWKRRYSSADAIRTSVKEMLAATVTAGGAK